MRVGVGILVMCVAWLGVARADEALAPGEVEKVVLVGDVEKTAERLEAYARAHAGENDAPRALERAIELRMLLRQGIGAYVALYLRLFRERDPLAAELIELRHARYVIKVRPTIPGALNRADTVLARLSASEVQVVRWPAMVLRAEHAKDRKRALGLYRQVAGELSGAKSATHAPPRPWDAPSTRWPPRASTSSTSEPRCSSSPRRAMCHRFQNWSRGCAPRARK